MCTAAVVVFSLFATAQEVADSAKIDILLLPNVELNEVNVLGTWAQKNDPIAQINLTQKDIEALNTGRDLPYVLQDIAGVKQKPSGHAHKRKPEKLWKSFAANPDNR